jgi:hypothetical protein
MRTKGSSTNQGYMSRRRLFICDAWVLLVGAAWLLASCAPLRAEGPKPDEHAKMPVAHRNVPTIKDGKKEMANGAASAACKIKADDHALVTNTGEAPSPKENDDQEQMSKTSNNASSGESLTLLPPVREDWTKDQIKLDRETNSQEESRSGKSEHSQAGSDLKCTPHEAVPKPEPTMPN